MSTLRDTGTWLGRAIAKIEGMRLVSDGSTIPVLVFELTGDPGFTVFDSSHELRAAGRRPRLPDARRARRCGAADRGAQGFSADLAGVLRDRLAEVSGRLRAWGVAASTAQHFAH